MFRTRQHQPRRRGAVALLFALPLIVVLRDRGFGLAFRRGAA
jgi:hypothetical protein